MSVKSADHENENGEASSRWSPIRLKMSTLRFGSTQTNEKSELLGGINVAEHPLEASVKTHKFQRHRHHKSDVGLSAPDLELSSPTSPRSSISQRVFSRFRKLDTN